MSDFEIIAGAANDLASIMPVMTSAFDKRFAEAWSEAQCLGIMSMPGSTLVIARSRAILGFALSRQVLDECELMLLAVDPAAQRGGIGTALLAHVVATARRANANSVHLEVRTGNSAIALYSAFGFQEVGRRRQYYRSSSGETFDALTYRYALS